MRHISKLYIISKLKLMRGSRTSVKQILGQVADQNYIAIPESISILSDFMQFGGKFTKIVCVPRRLALSPVNPELKLVFMFRKTQPNSNAITQCLRTVWNVGFGFLKYHLSEITTVKTG